MSKKSIYKIANKFEFKLRKLAQPCDCRICSSGGNCKEEPATCQCECGCKEPTYSGLTCYPCNRGNHLEMEEEQNTNLDDERELFMGLLNDEEENI